MYDDSGRPPIASSKLLIIFIIALIVVFGGTILLNGGFSSPSVDQEPANNSSAEDTASTLNYKMIGSNSYGTVTKISGFGDPSSDIKVALIAGVDSKVKSANAIVPTLQNEDMLRYCYDIYIVNTTSISNNNSDANNNTNLTENDMSESLASEFAVPDIINNNYNFTVDIHSTNDSNSYIFVPSENTYTSKIVVDSISNNTDVGKYTPDSHAYTEEISEKIISYEIPSIVYVTRDYYNENISSEISTVINAIDQFDFFALFNSNSDVSPDSNVTTESNQKSNSTGDAGYNNTVYVSNSSGNSEVN